MKVERLFGERLCCCFGSSSANRSSSWVQAFRSNTGSMTPATLWRSTHIEGSPHAAELMVELAL